MHFDVFVEDQSGKKTLDILIPKMIGNKHSFSVKAYKGLGGKIPKNLKNASEARHRILLDCLPKIVQGLGKTYEGYGAGYQAVAVIICDLDDRCLHRFRQELYALLHACTPQPQTRFCIAIEEGEAWFLGDREALLKAYPAVRKAVLEQYVQDSICGTWEFLANALQPGYADTLKKQGWHVIGQKKSEWAEQITPHMCPDRNVSPSFNYFHKKLKELAHDAW